MILPQLADNYMPDKQVLPVWQQPKIDGVRGLHLTGGLTGRSLKPFKNKALTEAFSSPIYAGLDGELAAGPMHSSSLCRDTTSLTNTIKGTASVYWYIFDYITEETVTWTYAERYERAAIQLGTINDRRLILVPYRVCTTMKEVEALDQMFVEEGCEGSILRNPYAAYKPGRPSSKIQELMRIKRFTDSEATVTSIEEGRINLNEATVNELGRTERSSHAENQIPSGMLGKLHCIDLKTGNRIIVSPGAMDHPTRVLYFNQPELIVGKTITYTSFEKGVKDAPRFANFKNIRSAEDMPQPE